MFSKLWPIFRLTGLALIGAVTLIRLPFAYIDPNTGGMLFQLLAAIFAALTGFLLFFSRYIRMAMARIRRWLRGASAQSSDRDGEEATDEIAHYSRRSDSG
jgi:hypothetical protein